MGWDGVGDPVWWKAKKSAEVGLQRGTESIWVALDTGAIWYLTSELSEGDVLCGLMLLHLLSMQTRIRAGGAEAISKKLVLQGVQWETESGWVTASSTLKKSDSGSASDYDNKNTENIWKITKDSATKP